MEPIYEYRKGQGWVVIVPDNPVITMLCGTLVRVEARKPEIGERYAWADNRVDYEWIRSDGTPVVERFLDYLASEYYRFIGCWGHILEADLVAGINANDPRYLCRGYITIVEVK